MTDRLRPLPLTRTALLLDAVAIGCLAPAIGAAFQRDGLLSLLLLACLFGVPAAAAGAVTSAVALVREAERRGVRRRVTVPIAAVLAVAAVPVGWAAVGAAWEATPNPAEAALRPVVAAAQDSGAVRLCDEGDPGLGPDNTQPWRTVWLRMPDDDAALARVRAAAAARGYALQEYRPAPGEGDVTGPGARHFRSGAPGQEHPLQLDASSGTMPLNCTGGVYGRPFHPAAGEIGVELSLVLPERT